MDNLDLENGEWSAVRVGPTLVGWVGRKLPKVGSAYNANVIVVMGEEKLPLIMHDLHWAYMASPNFHSEALGTVMEMAAYGCRVALPVPVGSIDVLPSGGIDYTARTGECLIAALHNFCTALANDIQADLHNRTPVGVVRKWSELAFHNYPKHLLHEMTWHGKQLNEVVQGTTIQGRVIRRGFSVAVPYIDFSKTFKLFTTLVDWQVRGKFNSARVIPENVVCVRANSVQEYELGKSLFGKPKLLEQYLIHTKPNVPDASFFLCLKGDPLEDWIDGEDISVSEFSAVASKLAGNDE